MSDSDAWVKNLKVGDKVIVSPWNRPRVVDEVAKVLPTGRLRLRKHTGLFANGTECGSGWDRALLVEATPERIAEITFETASRSLVNMFRAFECESWLKELTLDEVNGMRALMRKGRALATARVETEAKAKADAKAKKETQS